MDTNLRIEVEMRSIFDEKKYKELQKFLDENAKDLGQDDKDVYFFLLPDRVVKSVNNISKQTAKIVIKLTRVGKGENDTEEIEIPISPDDFDKSVKLFKSLPFDQVQRAYQKRKNYLYKSIELALKYSDSWGYHLELEIMTDDKSKVQDAEKKLRKLAKELDVKIMSPQEQAEFVAKIDSTYKKH